MTEKDIVALGFKKQLIEDEESNNGYDYYYYTLNLTEGLELVSSESDEVVNDNWTITSYDVEALNFNDKDQLSTFIQIIKSNLIKN